MDNEENLDMRPGESQPIQPVQKVAPDKVKGATLKNNIVPRLNKKAIMMGIIGVVGVTLITMSLPQNEKKAKIEEKEITATALKLDHERGVSGIVSTIEEPVVETAKTASTVSTPVRKAPLPPKAPSIEKTPAETKVADRPTTSARETTRAATTSAPAVDEELARAIAQAEYEASMSSFTPINQLETRYLATYGETLSASTNPAMGGTGSGTSQTRAAAYKDWNDQESKKAFGGEAGGLAVARLPQNIGNTIYAGTIIPAVLITGINTDLPGDVLAIVTENVYDTVTGENILIQQGSRILARYNSGVPWGQKRVQIVWERLIRPDGVSIDLGAMNGVDSKGQAGNRGRVDEHLDKYAIGIGMMTLMSVVTGQLEYTASTLNEAGASILNQADEQVETVGTEYVSKAMEVQPTIKVAQGTKISVFVNSDMLLPIVADSGVARKYSLQGGGK